VRFTILWPSHANHFMTLALACLEGSVDKLTLMVSWLCQQQGMDPASFGLPLQEPPPPPQETSQHPSPAASVQSATDSVGHRFATVSFVAGPSSETSGAGSGGRGMGLAPGAAAVAGPSSGRSSAASQRSGDSGKCISCAIYDTTLLTTCRSKSKSFKQQGEVPRLALWQR